MLSNLVKNSKLKKNDLSYLDIQKIINLYSSLDHRDLKDILENDIQKK
jgi:hypothetical protein